MGALSIWHWLVLLIVVLIVFGTKKLGSIGGDLGMALRDFKHALNDKDDTSTKAATVSEQQKLPVEKEERNT
ncbi:MAG: Sec-independent protein translocase subunit TatA [Gammaproteobacteria bacterium]|nr:Sec-independent protein translocase subunit TatA [Gammaproteobacteria bacterium]